MEVNSHNIEFGYELLSAVPHAYDLFKRGELTGTVSGSGSAPLYYFSPRHRVDTSERAWGRIVDARRDGLPYTFIHSFERPDLVFPPYKKHFANTEYKWEKPTLVIANRCNIEWGARAINYFDAEILDWLFSNLKKDYEIVYFAVSIPKELQDSVEPIDIGDLRVARKHRVKVFQDIKGDCWNTSMLRVFANCEHYITMNGGYSILASLFGGTNIIYSRGDTKPHTKEITVNAFRRWYPNHGDQRTVYVSSYEGLRDRVYSLYVERHPTLNVLIRTHGRPKAFARCFESVARQGYPNINIVVITDEERAVRYTRRYPSRHIFMPPVEVGQRPDGREYGVPFPYNEYIDRAQRRVEGYILVLDDDDTLHEGAAEAIMRHAHEDRLTVWRGNIHGRVIPGASFGEEVRVCDIGSFCFCYHTKHIERTDWSPWKRADYRTARGLAGLGITWVDQVLASTQGKEAGRGRGRDIDEEPTRTIRVNGRRMRVRTRYSR